jgi:hypothetical protein
MIFSDSLSLPSLLFDLTLYFSLNILYTYIFINKDIVSRLLMKTKCTMYRNMLYISKKAVLVICLNVDLATWGLTKSIGDLGYIIFDTDDKAY